jgi:protein gp37
MKGKIEWCDETWNPVWGCPNDCSYCYARKIAQRFGKTEDERNFIPSWREAGFQKKFKKSTKRVFVNSMSDLMYWLPAWMEMVIGRIRQHPEIQFIFLTKGGYEAYMQFDYPFPENVVLGITATSEQDLPRKIIGRFSPASKWLINIEPILHPICSGYAWDIISEFKWIILGAETGSRKGKVIPDLYWYKHILTQQQLPVFMQPSLDQYTPPELIRREFIV